MPILIARATARELNQESPIWKKSSERRTHSSTFIDVLWREKHNMDIFA